MFKKLVQEINAAQGLDRILAPLEGKVAELEDFARVSLAKVAALRDESTRLLTQAKEIEFSAAAAMRYAEQLEEIFHA
jgi:hypothetical protein